MVRRLSSGANETAGLKPRNLGVASPLLSHLLRPGHYRRGASMTRHYSDSLEEGRTGEPPVLVMSTRLDSSAFLACRVIGLAAYDGLVAASLEQSSGHNIGAMDATWTWAMTTVSSVSTPAQLPAFVLARGLYKRDASMTHDYSDSLDEG
ncbi:uncharacterized protein LOC119362209 [Triticum dicoccoides]|uniref:uncharacterized protein LOC119362209 n=1 Tax=Triticum dicoccoides TaxID=85692 RepID=UPI000E7967D2|nr:uncharacterized protein LOC119362209 [Triticum dicoccoides]